MSSEFVIKKGPKEQEAKIFSGKEEVGKIKKGEFTNSEIFSISPVVVDNFIGVIQY